MVNRAILAILCAALFCDASPALAAWHCPPLTADIARTHTRPEGGEKLLHSGEQATVILKADVHPDGSADIGVRRSSGLSALNDLTVRWVRAHWRWPAGCTPGSTVEIRIDFAHLPGW